jgi:ribosomal protein S27E
MNETPRQPVTDAMQTKCPACGGIMQYSPADENLKCVYCGGTTELDKTPVEIHENDFLEWKERADAEAPNESMAEAAEIKCRQCGATTSLPPNVSGAMCAFCGTPLIMQEASVRRFWQPEYLLPFKVTNRQGADNFKYWLRRRWFLPTALKKYGANADTLRGVYLPYWTYDAETSTDYTGERGEDRTESYRNEKGETLNRTVTDWYGCSGHVRLSFDDVTVPATDTLPRAILDSVAQWDMENCVAYRKEFLAGFVTELYRRDFREAFADAKEKMRADIETAVKGDIGGDRQRIASQTTGYDGVKFKHLLLPVWVSAFRYKEKIYQFVVNGRTGRVAGRYPRSAAKVVLFWLSVLAATALLVWLIGLLGGDPSATTAAPATPATPAPQL